MFLINKYIKKLKPHLKQFKKTLYINLYTELCTRNQFFSYKKIIEGLVENFIPKHANRTYKIIYQRGLLYIAAPRFKIHLQKIEYEFF